MLFVNRPSVVLSALEALLLWCFCAAPRAQGQSPSPGGSILVKPQHLGSGLDQFAYAKLVLGAVGLPPAAVGGLDSQPLIFGPVSGTPCYLGGGGASYGWQFVDFSVDDQTEGAPFGLVWSQAITGGAADEVFRAKFVWNHGLLPPSYEVLCSSCSSYGWPPSTLGYEQEPIPIPEYGILLLGPKFVFFTLPRQVESANLWVGGQKITAAHVLYLDLEQSDVGIFLEPNDLKLSQGDAISALAVNWLGRTGKPLTADPRYADLTARRSRTLFSLDRLSPTNQQYGLQASLLGADSSTQTYPFIALPASCLELDPNVDVLDDGRILDPAWFEAGSPGSPPGGGVG